MFSSPEMESNAMKPGDEVRIPVAIIDLFHLLPNAPEKFLEPLVRNVLNLETILPQLSSFAGKGDGEFSPYRRPLLKYLNKFAVETVSFFLRNDCLLQTRFSHMFQSILRSPEAVAIRSTLMVFFTRNFFFFFFFCYYYYYWYLFFYYSLTWRK